MDRGGAGVGGEVELELRLEFQRWRFVGCFYMGLGPVVEILMLVVGGDLQ